eukprot:138819-Amphidinium_carterae.1
MASLQFNVVVDDVVVAVGLLLKPQNKGVLEETKFGRDEALGGMFLKVLVAAREALTEYAAVLLGPTTRV